MEFHKLYERLSGRTPTILGSKHYTKFAVLLPIVERDSEPHILFEVRAYHLRRQPGEICFPGGKIDEHDEGAMAAAIRETSEELGIVKELIKDVFPLDYLITPFGTVIYPFVGYVSAANHIKPNRDEVADIFYIPLSFFLQTKPEVHYVSFQARPSDHFPFEKIPGGENYNWQTRAIEELFYYYGDKVIWGLTARILNHFIELIQQEEV